MEYFWINYYIYLFLDFYFSFGFCAVYIYQRGIFILCLIITIIRDFLLLEILWELYLCFYIKLEIHVDIWLFLENF